MSEEDATRESSTETNYLKAASGLIKRFERESKRSFLTSGDEFLEWFISLKPGWRKSSWRFNKAAVVHYFRVNHMAQLHDSLLPITSEGCLVVSGSKKVRRALNRTSSSKKKGVSAQEQQRIAQYLYDNSAAKWNERTLYFFTASIITGLRPSEWKDPVYKEVMTLEDGREVGPVLRVRNAKNTNGRSHGEFRHLILSDIGEQGQGVIKRHMRNIVHYLNEEGGTFDKYYLACKNALYVANKKIWRQDKSKKPTLYSGRHQFSANLKLAGYTRAEVAALMGHAVDDTANEHYGKKKVGRKSGGLVKALPTEVARVREVLGSSVSEDLRQGVKPNKPSNKLD